MSTATEARSNPLAQIDWDYVEFYVGNAKQAAHYYMSALASIRSRMPGPETGVRDRVSYLLEQNKLRFVLTASLVPDDEIARHVMLHGDGVKDIAILVADAKAAFEMAVRGGARVVLEPTVLEDASGRLIKATIATYGETVHSFVQRDGYAGLFAPGFVEARKTIAHATKPGLQFIDHCVGNVGWGEMDAWGDFYGRVFGFSQLVSFDDKDISTEFTALRSKVMTDPRHRVKFPINEPAQGKKKSQIEEYLDFYRGAGVQHMAIRTDDIAATIRALKENGVEFPRDARIRTTKYSKNASERSTKRWRRCASCAFSSIATTWGTCCRSSPSRFKTGRPSSSRSSSAKAASRSVKGTSRRSSFRSSASKKSEERCSYRRRVRSGPSARLVSPKSRTDGDALRAYRRWRVLRTADSVAPSVCVLRRSHSGV